MRLGPTNAEFNIDAADFDVVHVELKAGKLRIAFGIDAASALRIGGALTRAGMAAKNSPAHVSAARISSRLLKRARS